jgi:hypothetical protein
MDFGYNKVRPNFSMYYYSNLWSKKNHCACNPAPAGVVLDYVNHLVLLRQGLVA